MTKVSGFVEWLPEQRRVELQWMDEIRRTFESYGYCSIETPSVEEIEALLAKGETDKEIYIIKRLQEGEEKSDVHLGLHYDLTVPLARYVAEHYHNLVFPFKRYQIQRAWRGERPQEGRYREFYQCDIDVINNATVPLHFDSENARGALPGDWEHLYTRSLFQRSSQRSGSAIRSPGTGVR